MTEVTGYALREAIKRKKLAIDVAVKLFSDSFKAFPGETKDPIASGAKLAKLELELAVLQDVQSRYNREVVVSVNSRDRRHGMSLALAIKTLGGQARLEKLWRGAATPQKRERWDPTGDTLDNDKTYSKPTLPPEQLLLQADDAARAAADLRQAIALGNATVVEFKELEPAILG